MTSRERFEAWEIQQPMPQKENLEHAQISDVQQWVREARLEGWQARTLDVEALVGEIVKLTYDANGELGFTQRVEAIKAIIKKHMEASE